MSGWLIAFLAAAGALFAVKMLFVIAAAGALPVTGGALFVSSSSVRVNAFLDAVTMNPDQLLIDLGCGDGRVLRAAHQRYGVRALGFEVNFLAWLSAGLRCLSRRKIRVKWGDFRRADLSEADVVFIYLFPDVLHDIAAKLAGDLRPGAVVACCNFPMPGWTPEQTIRPQGDRHSDPIHIYRLPDCLPAVSNKES